MDEQLYSIWISEKTGIRPAIKCRLYDTFSSFKGIYEGSEDAYKAVEGLRPSDVRALMDKDLKKASDIQAYCLKNGIGIVDLNSPLYPGRLKNIYDPPLVIYVKGRLPDIDSLPVISVIGTRKADDYGLKVSSDIAFEISVCGGTVVSGLTSGADASAAEGALASGKPVIAVLGTSHDKCTTALSKKVSLNGALISEYPPGTDTNKSHFRARNRIAAGISVGVVVTQAPAKSGTRLFAAEAAEQGKDIFVVPGNVDSENSEGIYELMRDGAVPVISGRDVMREYVSAFPDAAAPDAPFSDRPARPAARIKSNDSSMRKKKSVIVRNEAAQTSKPEANRFSALTDKQRSAAECLAGGCRFVEEIMYSTGIPVNELLSTLTLLEIKGFVKRLDDGSYSLK